MLNNYFASLHKIDRKMVKKIIKYDSQMNKDLQKINDLLEKIDKLRKKYVNAFRQKNPDLRHFKVEQIKDYTDLLIKESQNLR